MQTNTGKQYSAILTEAMRDEFRNLICESGLDENEVINFGRGRTYPKYGQAVVMCGGGGCEDPDTPIMMSDLTIKKIKDIQVGDYVMGDDCQPRLVLNTVKGQGPMYRVHQTSGEDYIVNDEHILTLKKAEHCKKPYGNITKAGTLSHPNGRYTQYPDILDINVVEFAEKSKRFRENFLGFKVNTIHYPEQEVLSQISVEEIGIGDWCGIQIDGNQRYLHADGTVTHNSGKGFVINNLLPIDGKQLDVDSFKEKYKELLWNPNSAIRREDPRIGDKPFEPGYAGMDPDQAYNMANPDDVYALHVNTSDWKGMQRKGIQKGMVNPDRLNNLIFDITGKSERDIMSCVRMCKDVGYTMHLVWVVTSRSRALQQNFSRERKVPQEILHTAHNKIMEFLPSFITSEAGKYFEHCWLVFNSQPGLDGSKVENPCVELPKQDGRFVISDEVKERLVTTLGPKEVNPSRPQTYLDAKEIAPQDKSYSTPKMNKSRTIHADGTETVTKTPAVDKRGKPIMNVSNTETDKYGRDYRGTDDYIRK